MITASVMKELNNKTLLVSRHYTESNSIESYHSVKRNKNKDKCICILYTSSYFFYSLDLMFNKIVYQL